MGYLWSFKKKLNEETIGYILWPYHAESSVVLFISTVEEIIINAFIIANPDNRSQLI